jgi:hypothetical protein
MPLRLFAENNLCVLSMMLRWVSKPSAQEEKAEIDNSE